MFDSLSLLVSLIFQLIIGNFGLSFDQSKMQMAIWSILAAPLIMSTDLKNIRPEFKDILLNQQIIAVNQDELGIQGLLERYEYGIQVNENQQTHTHTHTFYRCVVKINKWNFVISLGTQTRSVGYVK